MSGALVSYGETQVLTALRNVLLSFLPAGIPVIRAEVNRIPEPEEDDWILMTPVYRERLSTNVVGFQDIIVPAAISGTTMTLTGTLTGGSLVPGQGIVGPSVTAGTAVTAGTITEGATTGSVQIAPGQTLDGTFYAGIRTLQQNTEIHVQIDVHGPNSADNTQRISTILRDGYGCELFAEQTLQAAVTFGGQQVTFQAAAMVLGQELLLDVSPLYVGEPRQIPFINAEQQYEWRWTLDVVLEANQVVTVPQEFAATLSVTTVIADLII